MKRSIRYAALVMAAAMALSACSNNSETTETEASPAQSETAVTETTASETAVDVTETSATETEASETTEEPTPTPLPPIEDPDNLPKAIISYGTTNLTVTNSMLLPGFRNTAVPAGSTTSFRPMYSSETISSQRTATLSSSLCRM